MSPGDLLLLLADGASGNYAFDRIRLMKAAFLVEKKGPPEARGTFTFRPYDYGPFDQGVYQARDKLLTAGLLVSDPSARYDDYSLTETGAQRVAELEAELGEEKANWIRNVGNWITSRSFTSLIQSIYAAYPEYAKYSALVRG